MNYYNKSKRIEIDTVKNNTPNPIMLNDNQRNEIRNKIKELDRIYCHLLSSGDYDEMEKLRSKIANLEIKLR